MLTSAANSVFVMEQNCSTPGLLLSSFVFFLFCAQSLGQYGNVPRPKTKDNFDLPGRLKGAYNYFKGHRLDIIARPPKEKRLER